MLISEFYEKESGATSIEYGLISALLSLVIIVAFTFLDSPVNGLFGDIVNRFIEISAE